MSLNPAGAIKIILFPKKKFKNIFMDKFLGKIVKRWKHFDYTILLSTLILTGVQYLLKPFLHEKMQLVDAQPLYHTWKDINCSSF